MNKTKEKPIELSAEDCLKRRRKSFPPTTMDVREAAEREAGGLPGSVALPNSEWEFYFEEMPRIKVILFMDQDGSGKAIQAAQWARAKGMPNAYAIEGGWEAMKKAIADDGESLKQIPQELWKEKLENLFDREIRPILEADGGGAEIVDVSEKELMIRYLGACTTCTGGQDGTIKLISGYIENFFNYKFDVKFQV